MNVWQAKGDFNVLSLLVPSFENTKQSFKAIRQKQFNILFSV
jgi:hypothetical protein